MGGPSRGKGGGVSWLDVWGGFWVEAQKGRGGGVRGFLRGELAEESQNNSEREK